ncbi:class D sortase [Fictibacillus sp. 5RED26]|uniref:class D sortase n=1 Tax=Fictibacillus sp. 5RED26 TaxID=2745876 RepID=UPI0018CE59F8|nr:class D sortase [Fictibacillus sp. 5RED26]MBH0156594.1 class D sortase [Fictibacillus sp. 5RED26]
MRWLAYLLIFAGVMTMAYPKAKSVYFSYQEQRLLEDWESSNDQSKIKQSYKQLDDIFLSQDHKEHVSSKTGIIGKLTINQIQLSIPILEGATKNNLKVGAGHLSGTSPLGKTGNAAIAAHRSYTFGKQFNRLPEVRPGDSIQVETAHQKLTYTVTEEILVKPTDLSVLQNNKKNEAMITLITCHPMKNPTHRYIVKAVLKKEEVL